MKIMENQVSFLFIRHLTEVTWDANMLANNQHRKLQMNDNNRKFFFTLLFLLSMTLSACGGGGRDTTTQPPSTNSNWDAMTWGQDNWE